LAPRYQGQTDQAPELSALSIRPDIPICQTDLPLDRYQEEFRPYAEEYLALPDRLPITVLPWMDRYIQPALDHFGDQLMLLAHYYMGGEIVKLVERYGGKIADSYALALQTRSHPETRVFVESAVHFMAESIAILAAPEQEVYITNPRSGCTMEMMAKDYMIEPVFDALEDRYGDALMVIAYMNTSGRIKALAGRTGGAVCTSSNAHIVLQWARSQNKKVFFVPDQHLGENAAAKSGISPDQQFIWPGPKTEPGLTWNGLGTRRQAACDQADLILWGGFCGVHTVFRPEHVTYWQERGRRVLVHPECPKPVVDAADGAGSTAYLWREVALAKPGDQLAVATEGHFVRNAREQAALRNVDVVHMADIPEPEHQAMGCGCATMSRNDPPHLVAILDLLRKGEAPTINRVHPGDAVNERTGWRERLSDEDQADLVAHARVAMENMIRVTEAA